jgi:hypothetical protein
VVLPIFAIQFIWFSIAWTTLAVLWVAPWARRREWFDAMAIWVAPHLFRVLGAGLLVPNLAPDLPTSFALPTAVGDGVTAVLALACLVALRRRWHAAPKLVAVFLLVGTADLVVALGHAVTVRAAHHLTGQWYVPALGVPLMIVSHAYGWLELVRGRAARASATTPTG